LVSTDPVGSLRVIMAIAFNPKRSLLKLPVAPNE
jgi:hypothetical protein